MVYQYFLLVAPVRYEGRSGRSAFHSYLLSFLFTLQVLNGFLEALDLFFELIPILFQHYKSISILKSIVMQYSQERFFVIQYITQ